MKQRLWMLLNFSGVTQRVNYTQMPKPPRTKELLNTNGLSSVRMREWRRPLLKLTVISREYSSERKPGDEPYYPVNDEKNGALYAQYSGGLLTLKEKLYSADVLSEYKILRHCDVVSGKQHADCAAQQYITAGGVTHNKVLR
ncbi:MAG: UDP-galactopyranose mutase [Lachnospira eligens]